MTLARSPRIDRRGGPYFSSSTAWPLSVRNSAITPRNPVIGALARGLVPHASSFLAVAACVAPYRPLLGLDDLDKAGCLAARRLEHLIAHPEGLLQRSGVGGGP
jgi:hypothetical protein